MKSHFFQQTPVAPFFLLNVNPLPRNPGVVCLILVLDCVSVVTTRFEPLTHQEDHVLGGLGRQFGC